MLVVFCVVISLYSQLIRFTTAYAVFVVIFQKLALLLTVTYICVYNIYMHIYTYIYNMYPVVHSLHIPCMRREGQGRGREGCH